MYKEVFTEIVMRNKTRGFVFALFGVFLVSVPLWAHHSVTAEFDPKKNFTITGTLKKLDWTNPHIYFWVEAKDENGQSVTYGIEASPPGMLHRAGVTRDMFQVGGTVTVIASPAKDGTKNIGFGKRMTFADGHSVVLYGGRDDNNTP